MQQLAESAPSPSLSTFASLLAALAAPAAAKPASPWPDDGLADDVATLSYERALKTHARYKRPDPPVWALPATALPDSVLMEPPAAGPNQAPADASVAATSVFEPLFNGASEEPPAPAAGAQPSFAGGKASAAANQRDRKSASITIRISQAECEQLRRRAADAGLTISAYLRSCTLEAESLRAQVKDALTQLRSAPAAAAPRRASWLRRLARR